MIASIATSLGEHTSSVFGLAALAAFAVAYLLVVLEDVMHLRKSVPVIAAAAVLWVLIAVAAAGSVDLEARVSHHLAEFAALFLFLMVAMTYISAIGERNVFLRINAWLISRGWGFRAVFWATGVLSFWLSAIADNLTTALFMGAVVLTVGAGSGRFVAIACCNVVVAANAGGAFSPFGDITTLMVWQAGKVPTAEFLTLLPAALVNWLVPAGFMHFALPDERPAPLVEEIRLKEGWLAVIALFLATIATAVVFHGVLHLPPFLGMMCGLGYYFVWAWRRSRRSHRTGEGEPVDALGHVAKVEWDTLLFFFGVIMCIGALHEFGYLRLASDAMYAGHDPFWANVCVGLISAVIDNVPVMFAVLGMDPPMNLAQWLLVTLTAGVGGSLLSVGSAAGVAMMGIAQGKYTFFGHLRWLPVIALGYAASICVHVITHDMNAPAPAAAAPQHPAAPTVR